MPASRLAAALAGAFALTLPAAAAAEPWPVDQTFVIADAPRLVQAPHDPVEAPDGAVLVAVAHEVQDTPVEFHDEYRLRRIGRDGTRRFVSPFSDAGGHSPEEVLPLPGGALLFAERRKVWKLSRAGTVTRFAGRPLRPGDFQPGDGGPATKAWIGSVNGLSRAADGSIYIADATEGRVRRVAPDGTITTVAGTGGTDAPRDGVPAAQSTVFPEDVLALPDGGFLIAQGAGGRVRRVAPDGIIQTIAGTGTFSEESTGDDGPALAADLAAPHDLGLLPDGSIVVAESHAVRRIDPGDGTIDTVFSIPQVRGSFRGDFAGRTGSDAVLGMSTTAEGGVLVTVNTFHGERTYMLAPRDTDRALVSLQDTRASERNVEATVVAARPGTVTLEVRRGTATVARKAVRIGRGRHSIAVRGRFPHTTHDVRVVLRTRDGQAGRDQVGLLTSSVLPKAAVLEADDQNLIGCKRFSARRLDCAYHSEDAEDDERPCVVYTAYRLEPSGVVWERGYGKRCPQPRRDAFQRTPDWHQPWTSLEEIRPTAGS